MPENYAAFHGRDYVIPDDVQALAQPVLAHRLFPAARPAQCWPTW
jgi:MoxR-like ATPase